MIKRREICNTLTLPRQNEYTLALNGELSYCAFDEQRAPLNKGQWRNLVFKKNMDVPMDLEIGTGNGLHFAHRSFHYPDRLIVGIELKYKPLVQSMRRALRHGGSNAAMVRYHAFNIEELFTEGELNDVFIHFPDPWVSPRKPKNRLVSQEMLSLLSRLQRPGSKLEFKTDSRESFDWSLDEIKKSSYKILFQSFDYHKEKKDTDQLVTNFENIFIQQEIPINYILLEAVS